MNVIHIYPFYIFTYLSTPQLLHNRQSLGYSTHCGPSTLCLTCISSLPSLTCPSHAVFLEELGTLRVPTWCVTALVTVPSTLPQPLQVVPILRTWFSSAVSYIHTHVCMHDHDILSICEVICSMLLFLYSKSLYMYHAHSATVVMYVHMYHLPHYISTLPLHRR